jgi:hypothetical protein
LRLSGSWNRVDWLARLQVRPRDGKPLADFRGNGRDRELTRIVEEILDTVERLSAAGTGEKSDPKSI